MRLMILLWIAPFVQAHAPLTPSPQGPLRVSGNELRDGAGNLITLWGALLPGLEVPASRDDVFQDRTFGIMRVRWNLNAVRLPVSVALWQRDGSQYLDRVTAIVNRANAAGLVVILAPCEEARCGAARPTGLPGADTIAFWRAWAARFRENPRVIFAAFRQPSSRNIPGAVFGQRSGSDWQFWLRGGTLIDGRAAAGMQEVVDTIRGTGAQQVIAVPAFHEPPGFTAFGEAWYIRDANVVYEVHPYFDQALTDSERDARFGFLASRFPVYAGEWGLTLATGGNGCESLPRDAGAVTGLIFQTLSYFSRRGISWTAASFETGSLVRDADGYQPTTLDALWTCGAASNPQPGMGETLITWTTGDPTGFGVLRREQIANAAGGSAGPIAPGEILSIYAEQLGPDPGVSSSFDAFGYLPLVLGGTRVLFDGAPAPILYAGAFQINVQVPYHLEPGKNTVLQVLYGSVPSNLLSLDTAEAAPELFQEVGTRVAIALNQDGARHSASAPAQPGSIMVFFASGGGKTSPEGVAGRAAPSPHPVLVSRVEMTVGGRDAQVLFAGEVPGFAGLVQINARLPDLPGSTGLAHALPVVLRVGGQSSRVQTIVWVR
jgi:uncharacterized protein (TIGR03437 family)